MKFNLGVPAKLLVPAAVVVILGLTVALVLLNKRTNEAFVAAMPYDPAVKYRLGDRITWYDPSTGKTNTYELFVLVGTAGYPPFPSLAPIKCGPWNLVAPDVPLAPAAPVLVASEALMTPVAPASTTPLQQMPTMSPMDQQLEQKKAASLAAAAAAPVAAAPTLDNANLMFNPDGPAWQQQVLIAPMIPPNSTIPRTAFGRPIGPPDAPLILSDAGPWTSNVAYSIPGQIVSYNGSWYMNMAWNQDKRGAAYSGNNNQNPTTDKYAWRPVLLTDNDYLVFNPKGPVWNQQVIMNAGLKDGYLPGPIGSSFPAGSPRAFPIDGPPLIIETSYAGIWEPTVGYSRPGQIVQHKDKYYMNKVWNRDLRGSKYRGNFNQNPLVDSVYAWAEVNLRKSDFPKGG